MVHSLFFGAATGLCTDAHTFSAELVSEVKPVLQVPIEYAPVLFRSHRVWKR